MSDPAETRERLAELSEGLARARGESSALGAEIEHHMGELRDLLDCDEGEEFSAIKKLEKTIKKEAARIAKKLDEVDSLMESE